jgi:hypothetical protein
MRALQTGSVLASAALAVALVLTAGPRPTTGAPTPQAPDATKSRLGREAVVLKVGEEFCLQFFGTHLPDSIATTDVTLSHPSFSSFAVLEATVVTQRSVKTGVSIRATPLTATAAKPPAGQAHPKADDVDELTLTIKGFHPATHHVPAIVSD